ncbi:MAG TPA: protease inhibitor I42 family protein [Polyangiaceae bacterium]|nr:protease inhibitor I42 family protein [Polyangiaceae bacterium]
MIRYGLALCALALIACNGCNDKNAPPAAAPTPAADAASPSEVIVHVEDDGKTIDVARGGVVAFKLAGNAGTGYVWTAAQVDASILTPQGDRTVESTSDTPGAPKFDVLRFTAQGAGSTVVQMALKRPFGSSPPARTVQVTVNVH